MVNIPSFKAPSLPASPDLSLLGSKAGVNVGSIGANIPNTPTLPTLGINTAVPNFSAPSLPTNAFTDAKTQIAEKIPKFDSKIDLPEIQPGKLGLLSSTSDLGAFKEKTMSSLNSMIPPFSPGEKISALKAAADKKLEMLNGLKSAAGGALGAAAGAALAGGNLKSIAGSALGAAAGGIAGNLAGKAGIGAGLAGAVGSAAGALAAGGNLKQAVGGAVGSAVGSAVGNLASKTGVGSAIGGAVGSIAGVAAAGGNTKSALGSAAGGLVASGITSKFGAGIAGSAAGAVIGSKLSGGSSKASLIGGLTAGAGAFAAQKMFSAPISPVAGATSIEKIQSKIPSNIDLITTTKGEPLPESAPPRAESPVPPPSGTATIDSETGKVTVSSLAPSNVTTITETVIGGGSRTTYADRKDPVTGDSIPVPDKVIPPTKTVTTTVVNKDTGNIISTDTKTETITREQARAQASSARVTPPQQSVAIKPAPIVVPRPINPLFQVSTDRDGNEILSPASAMQGEDRTAALEAVSVVGAKDTKTVKYAEGTVSVLYTPEVTRQKFGYTPGKGSSNIEYTYPDGEKFMTLVDLVVDSSGAEITDFTYPLPNEGPYYVKDSNGLITYTFSDGNTATEIVADGKSLFTVQGVSAEVQMPVRVEPSEVELKIPDSKLDKIKERKKEEWLSKNGYNRKNENGDYLRYRIGKLVTDKDGKRLYKNQKTGETITVTEYFKLPEPAGWVALREAQPDTIIPKEKVNEEFEKEWKFLSQRAREEHKEEVVKKYENASSKDVTTEAESLDKNHIIQVVRSGYSSRGDSYKVKSVKLFKKGAEITGNSPAPEPIAEAAATPAQTPPPPPKIPYGLSETQLAGMKKMTRLTKIQSLKDSGRNFARNAPMVKDPATGLLITDPRSKDKGVMIRLKFEKAAKSLEKYKWIYPWEQGWTETSRWSDDKVNFWISFSGDNIPGENGVPEEW